MFFRHFSAIVLGCCCLTLLLDTNAADVMVQVNVNRPLNDVNEKFVSFAIKPEELYRALDGANRKSITRMAAMLGESYIKFTDDYDFATNTALKLRNPTNIIWKGFNRWASAVNWTMVIPVPYNPETWDPMETLRILNSSYLNGINNCVWQLGTDFGASRAQDFVSELGTLNLMVESFKPYVDDWRIMGADISAGSSAEETRRYLEMSRDLNAAFGWTQPNDVTMTTADDPALRMLLREKVPIWLTLPTKSMRMKSAKMAGNGNQIMIDETTEALQWARMLGESANAGFDAVFMPITAVDFERPNFSYYVSAVFKKTMGSRVFPARPLNAFNKQTKLYNHCANAVSGGIAFMIVNPHESVLQVQVHALPKTATTEIWQYILTMKKGVTLLNNERIHQNTTLRPQKSVKPAIRPVQLNLPGRSVGFFVIPTANLEHCQYTEMATEVTEHNSAEQKVPKRYSSADKLLRRLIQESSLANSALARAINRRRRYATAGAKRHKRFVLKDHDPKPTNGWGRLFEHFGGAGLAGVAPAEESLLRPLRKRENAHGPAAPAPGPFDWLGALMENAELPLLNRAARSVDDDYFGPLFATKDGKTTTVFTKKITEIKKPEQEHAKPIFDLDEFDEEEFFRKIDNYREPERPRLPEGDVHLSHITNADGEEIDDEREDGDYKLSKGKQKLAAQSMEAINEMKPMRLLPTELYETLPSNPFKTPGNAFGTGLSDALNTLLFPEPFTKKSTVNKQIKNIEKETDTGKKHSSLHISEMANEFLRKQQDLSQIFGLGNEPNAESAEAEYKQPSKNDMPFVSMTTTAPIEESTLKTTTTTAASRIVRKIPMDTADRRQPPKQPSQTGRFHEILPDNFDTYFGETFERTQPKVDSPTKLNPADVNQNLDELSWWDFSPQATYTRPKRALYFNIPNDMVADNMITKDDDLLPLGAMLSPQQLLAYEYRVDEATKKQETPPTETPATPSTESTTAPTTQSPFVKHVQKRVTNLVDIVAKHVSEWYNTFRKHMDAGENANAQVDTATTTEATSNNVN